MTREDTKIIFSNVAELAVFSDTFVERLELALGSVLDGGVGDDYVGALFLEIVCRPHRGFFNHANIVFADTSHGTSIQDLHYTASDSTITFERLTCHPGSYGIP